MFSFPRKRTRTFFWGGGGKYILREKDTTYNKTKEKKESTNGKPINSLILIAKFGFIFLLVGGKSFLGNFLFGPQKSAYSVIIVFFFFLKA